MMNAHRFVSLLAWALLVLAPSLADVPPSSLLDADGDGALEGLTDGRTPATDLYGDREAPACNGAVGVIAYPYCHSGSGTGLSFVPGAGLSPGQLIFLTQTPFDEDLVWFDSMSFEEAGRCEPTGNATIGATALDTMIGCSARPSLFVANVTNGAGFIRELGVFPKDCPTCQDCCSPASSGQDELACRAGASCAPIREFRFDGLEPWHRVEGMAVADLPGFGRPLLAVGNYTTAELILVDPRSPYCHSDVVDVVHSCQIYDDWGPVRPTGIAWPGDDTLLVASRPTGLLYRIDPVTCDVLASCAPIGSGELGGLAHDLSTGRTYVADDEYSVIFQVEAP